jgi:hypothetical protein
MSNLTNSKLATASILLAACVLSACSDDNNNSNAQAPAPATTVQPSEPITLEYEVRVSNLTIGQPLSPVAIFVHDSAQATVFSVGSAASPALELLAEGGDNSELLNDYDSLVSASGESPVGPGANDTITVEVPVEDSADLAFTLVTMLVNTNDAFSAVNAADISSLQAGASLSFRTPSYDSGTEANSEQAGTIPGPVDGGEGFNEARDDVNDQVTMHGGVVSSADGLADSVLGEQHRWDNPVLTVTITRIR